MVFRIILTNLKHTIMEYKYLKEKRTDIHGTILSVWAIVMILILLEKIPMITILLSLK